MNEMGIALLCALGIGFTAMYIFFFFRMFFTSIGDLREEKAQWWKYLYFPLYCSVIYLLIVIALTPIAIILMPILWKQDMDDYKKTCNSN